MNKVNLTRILQFLLSALQVINAMSLFTAGSKPSAVIAAATGAIQIYIHEAGLKLPPPGGGGITQ